jgi:hypothetical protein
VRSTAEDLHADGSMLDQVNEAAVEWASERAAELVGMKYERPTARWCPTRTRRWAITDSTRELLRGDVAAAIDEGLSPAELADRLEESYAFSSTIAPMTIARTEIADADIQGSLIAYRESGVVDRKGARSVGQPRRSRRVRRRRRHGRGADRRRLRRPRGSAVSSELRVRRLAGPGRGRRNRRLTGPLPLTYTDST